MPSTTYTILDYQHRPIAEFDLLELVDEWYYGRLASDALPEAIRRDLDWYDEVVSKQLLSYIDDAILAVERHALSERFPDGTCHRAFALHVSKSGETEFCISPVPPPSLIREDRSASTLSRLDFGDASDFVISAF